MRRRIVATAVLLELAAPAIGCPPLRACVVTSAHSSTPSSVDDKADKHVTIDLKKLETIEPKHRDPDEIEMPWIWQALSAQVYSRMPSYEQSEGFKIVLSPVVVKSPSDTVPGVGIAGDF